MPKTATLIKKKRWVLIVAPPEFNTVPVGETYVVEPQDAVGRTLSVSLMLITGDPSSQQLHVMLRITGFQNNVLVTEITGYNIITSAVRKMMRRGKEKIEDSFIVVTKDGRNVRIKPIVVTKTKSTGAVLLNLHKNIRNTTLKMAAGLTFGELVMNLLSRQFQKQLQEGLRKIYPLSVCEIRWLSLEPAGVPIKEVETRVKPSEEPAAEQVQA